MAARIAQAVQAPGQIGLCTIRNSGARSIWHRNFLRLQAYNLKLPCIHGSMYIIYDISARTWGRTGLVQYGKREKTFILNALKEKLHENIGVQWPAGGCRKSSRHGGRAGSFDHPNTVQKKPPQVPEQHLRRLLFMLAGLSRGLKNAWFRHFLRTAVRRPVQVHGPQRQKNRSRRDTAWTVFWSEWRDFPAD